MLQFEPDNVQDITVEQNTQTLNLILNKHNQKVVLIEREIFLLTLSYLHFNWKRVVTH